MISFFADLVAIWCIGSGFFTLLSPAFLLYDLLCSRNKKILIFPGIFVENYKFKLIVKDENI